MIPAVLTESKLSTEDAADLLHVTTRTVIRWATHGRPVPAHPPVVLEAEQIGRKWVTSREAVGRFIAALKAARNPPPAPPVVTPAARARESARAKKILAKFGIGVDKKKK